MRENGVADLEDQDFVSLLMRYIDLLRMSTVTLADSDLGHATVDVELHPGDVARLIGREK